MPRKQTSCARRPGHKGSCIGPEGMARLRERTAEHAPLRVITPGDRERWNRVYRLKQYGLTPERFEEMLGAQGYACAMFSGCGRLATALLPHLTAAVQV